MDKKNIRILVSACLLGVNCRYDGKNGRRDEVLELLKEYELIPVCPEQMGGLGTPREPAECRRDGGQVRVMKRKGCDVTEYFEKGGEEALQIAKLYGCRYAILKERSQMDCNFRNRYRTCQPCQTIQALAGLHP